MFGNLGNLGNLMKQAQTMQERAKKAQEEIAAYVAEGEAGGGLVRVTMTGEHKVTKVEIADSVFGDDKDMCEDLLVTALNNAAERIREFSAEKMKKVTNGIPLPPGLNFPF